MTLKFMFFYKNLDYFLWLLQKVALAHSVELYAEMSSESCDESLVIFASGENLNDFATALESEIPLSLYFKLKGVELCEKPMNLTNLKSANLANLSTNIANDFFSVSEINAIKNPHDSRFCDIFTNRHIEIFSRHSEPLGEESKIDSQDLLQNTLHNLCALLKNGHKITLSTSKGKIALSTQRQNDFDYILANDISTLTLFTRATQEEINALASFEKPLINLAIKEVFAKEVGVKNALFILPYDIILCCISSILLELEIPLLYLKKIDSPKCDLNYKSEYSDSFFEIIIGQRGYFLQKKFLDSRESNISNLSHFLDLSFADFKVRESKKDSMHDSHDSNDIFIAYISTANPTLLANLSNKIPHIKIEFDKNPKNILAKITGLENGDKLIANFKREFGERYEAIQALDSAPQISENITDIFECAAMILGVESAESKSASQGESKSKQYIFQLAQSSLRDIGPKIDFKNITHESTLFYDESRTIRSIISFTLAGTEREIIAFGLLESLADYLVLIFRDAQSKNYIKNVGIIGDLFANKIFFDKITKKIPANFNLILPKYLDFKNCENIDSEG